MATFLPGGVDQFQNLVTPVDYNFLNYALATKENQYESGLNQVKSMYSSVLNAPITNGENQSVREEYMQDAKNQIQKLSKADLSLPQNIQQASKIFTPFYQDQDILHDMNKTRYIRSQLSTAQADNDSKDKATSDSYNPDAVTRIQWSLKDLQQSKRGDGSIAKVETPAYFKYSNPLDDVTAFNKATGFDGIKTEHHLNGYLIKTKNGVQAIPALTTYVNGILGDKHNHQFQTRAYNQYRSDIEQVKIQHPELNQPEALHQLVQDKYNTYVDESYTKPTSKLQDFVQVNQNAIDNINTKKIKTADDEALLRKFQSNIDQTNSSLTDLNTNKEKELYNNDNTLKKPEDIFQNFMKNPEHYYGVIERTKQIHQIAETLASTNVEYKEDIDPVWKFQQEEGDRKWEQRFKVSEAGRDQRNQDLDRKLETEKLKEKYFADQIDPITGKSTNSVTNITSSTGFHDEGRATTNVEDAGNVSTLIQEHKGNLLNQMNKDLFSSGLATNILGKLGMDTNSEDVRNFIGYMSRRYTGENYNATINWTPKEKEAFNKVATLMQSKNLITNASSDAIIDGLGKGLLNEIKNASIVSYPQSKQDQLASMLTSWNKVISNKQEFDNINTQQKAWIKNLIYTPEGQKKYSKLINEAGTDFVQSLDIAKLTPTLEVVDNEGRTKIINPKEIADAYLTKDVDISGNNLILKGKKYQINKVNNQPNTKFDTYLNGQVVFPSEVSIATLKNRFGDYNTREALNNDLNSNVATNLNYFKDSEGHIGRQFSLPIGKPDKPGSNEYLIQEALNPSNYVQMHYVEPNGSKGIVTKEENILAVNKYLNSVSNIINNKVQAKYNNVSGYHTPTVEIQLPEDKELGSMSGNKVILPLTPNAQGTVLSQIPRNQAISSWDKVNRGETLKANPWDKESGFDYTLSTKNPNDIKSYTFNWSYTSVDPQTGEEKIMPVEEPINVDAMTPAQIENLVNAKREASLHYLWSSRATYNAKHPAKK